MRLSTKMVLIFSAMMLLALLVLLSLSSQTVVDGSNAFTEMRFHNMAVSIARDLEDEFSMMQLTLQDLTDDPNFMSALKQIIRDDTDEQKMGLAAGKIAVSRLKNSPLVNTNYRVSFYTRDGVFLTWPALADEETYEPEPGTNRAGDLIRAFPWLDRVDQTDGICVLALHDDYFMPDTDTTVYGIVQKISYGGSEIGYLEIDQLSENLNRVMDYTDEENITVEVYLTNGHILFSNAGKADSDQLSSWPKDLTHDAYTRITPEGFPEAFNVHHYYLSSHSLHIIIAQPASVIDQNRNTLRWSMLRRSMYVTIPALLLIMYVSIRLTRSTRRLTRKVRRISSENMLSPDSEQMKELSETVTSPIDRETYELEQVLNAMMQQLRQNASVEIALREGTLHAQLNALQTQINPHFIYNTLNIISARSMESGNYDVIEICDQFAQMLRYSTDTRSRTATIVEEIENVRNYLMLAKARYEENLEFRIDVPESLNSISVPKLTLQPLVENALTHGFDGKNVLRKLTISGQVMNDDLILEIRDNGNGFSDEMLENLRGRIREIEEGKVSVESAGGHIGLVNTCLRLYYYSHGAMHIAIRNDNGAVITITMRRENKNPD